jgi:hypothetical protein
MLRRAVLVAAVAAAVWVALGFVPAGPRPAPVPQLLAALPPDLRSLPCAVPGAIAVRYRRDVAEADAAFKGQQMAIVGRVTSANVIPDGGAVVSLESLITCRLTLGSARTPALGDTVWVVGRFDGWVESTGRMADCRLFTISQ